MKVYGIIPPIVTPFDEAGELDITALKGEVARLMAAGVHGLSFAGSTGEGSVLSDEELTMGLRAVQEVNQHRLPLLCGIIRNSTRQGISAGMAAKAGGADVLMVTPTHYLGASPQGNADYFRAVHQATGLPIVIYNVIAGNPVLPGDLAYLTEDCGILGIKQSMGGIHALADMLLAAGDRFTVFGAQDDVMYLSYLLGAKGAISAIISLFPEECVAQWNAVEAGDIDAAKALHQRMLPVWREVEGKAFPGRLKMAMRRKGIANARLPRAPIVPYDDETEARIEAALRYGGFID